MARVKEHAAEVNGPSRNERTSVRRDEHPFLALQRHAGNGAVSSLLTQHDTGAAPTAPVQVQRSEILGEIIVHLPEIFLEGGAASAESEHKEHLRGEMRNHDELRKWALVDFMQEKIETYADNQQADSIWYTAAQVEKIKAASYRFDEICHAAESRLIYLLLTNRFFDGVISEVTLNETPITRVYLSDWEQRASECNTLVDLIALEIESGQIVLGQGQDIGPPSVDRAELRRVFVDPASSGAGFQFAARSRQEPGTMSPAAAARPAG
jgi:hypothetical protein